MNSSDRVLIHRWQQDADSEAFAELVRRHAAMVFGAANRILRNPADAEEIAQESFAKIGQIRRVRGESAGGLLHTIATHLAINRLKAESNRRAREIEYATSNDGVEQSDWVSMAPHVDEAIASLSPAQREAVVRHFLEGESYRAIAREQQLDESTVRHHAQRGLARIRRFLQRRGIAVATATLATELAGSVEAATVSSALATALGKQAIAGPPAIAGLSTATALGLGGTAIMMKKTTIGACAALLLAAGVGAWRLSGHELSPEDSTLDSMQTTTSTTAAVGQLNTATSDVDDASATSDAETTVPEAADASLEVESPGSPEMSEEAFAAMLAGAFERAAERDRAAAEPPEPISSDDVPQDNGMHFFLKAAELLEGQRDIHPDAWEDVYRRLAAGEALSEDEAARFSEMQEAFDLIRVGLEVGNIAMPVENPGPDLPLPFLPVWRHVARIMNLDAEFQMGQGNYGAGLDNYQTIVAFGNELGRGGPLITGLVGQAVGNIGIESLATTLVHGDLTASEYRSVIDSLQDVQANALTAWETLLNEQVYIVEWIEEMESKPDALRQFLFSVGEDGTASGATQSAFESVSDRELMDYFNQYREDFERLIGYSTLPYYEAIEYVENPDAIAPNILSQHIMPAVGSSMLAYAINDARLQGTIAIAGIEAYHLENGEYPSTLGALVPEYLASSPIDPFTGESLRYQPRTNGYRLYSTGADMTDDGGLVNDTRKPRTDIVFRK